MFLILPFSLSPSPPFSHFFSLSLSSPPTLLRPASSAYLAADDEYLQAWKWVAYGCALMTVVLLVVIAAMKSKIKIAIGIVKVNVCHLCTTSVCPI